MNERNGKERRGMERGEEQVGEKQITHIILKLVKLY
jgi:hypothetical protein